MADWAVDSSAVLAVFFGESGGDAVSDVLAQALISSVNLCEVVAKLVDKGRAEQDARALASAMPWRVAEFDAALALAAGGLRARTRAYGLSLGDRACLALAARERLPVLTADRAWAGLDIGVEIRLIR